MLLTRAPRACSLCEWAHAHARGTALPAWLPRRARAVASSRAAARPRRVNPGEGFAPPAHATPGVEFEVRFQELVAWKETYYECIVPRKAQDAGPLAEWVHDLRWLHRRGLLPPPAVERLTELGFAWEVNAITAKWHSNFHVARAYREREGTAEIPLEYTDASQPDLVEAARWLARQQELYEQQKLPQLRVRLLKEVLGLKLSREYSPHRRNMHEYLRASDREFRQQQRGARQRQPG